MIGVDRKELGVARRDGMNASAFSETSTRTITRSWIGFWSERSRKSVLESMVSLVMHPIVNWSARSRAQSYRNR